MPTSSSLGRVLLFSLCFVFLSGVARADEPRLQNGLAVVTDPATLARTASVGPTQVVELSVVLTELDFDGISAVQFGLDIDPRLTLLNTNFSADAGVTIEVAPGEWIVGFQRCASRFDTPYVVATLQLLTPADVAQLDDLTVAVRDLTGYGESIAVTRCSDARFVLDAVDMGGVVLNATGPSIPFFASSSDVVVEGAEYTLAWTTAGAASVLLDGQPVAAAGTATQTSFTSTSHTLTADGVTRTLDVEVIREPRIEFFTADIATDFDPPRTRLAWDVVGADTVELDGYGIQPPRGGLTVPLDAEAVYTLTATNQYGSVSLQTVVEGAQDAPPLVLTFSASPPVYGEGQPVTLYWSAYNADTASITPDVGPVDPRSGNTQVFPVGEVTYTLTLGNAFGTTTQTLTVQPSPPRIDQFTVSTNDILQGESVELAWQTRFADTLVLEPLGQSLDASGSLVLQPQATTTYQLVATNAYGQVVGTRLVEVTVPEITQFEIQPRAVFPGDEVVAIWEATPGVDLRIEPDVGPLTEAAGVQTFVPLGGGNVYALIGTVAGQDVLRAEVGPIEWLPPDVSWRIVSERVTPNQPFQLQVDCAGCESVVIDPGPGLVESPPPSILFTGVIGEPTTFVATATNPAGTTVESLLVEPEPLAPQVTFDLVPLANGGVLFPGDPVRLSWTVLYSASATLLPGVGAIANGTGTATIAVDDPTTFTLVAENAYGTTTVTADAIPQPPVVTLTGSENALPGGDFELVLQVAGQTEVSIEPIFGVVPGSGTYTSTLDSSTTFTATAVNPAGSSTATWRVELAAPSILNFSATQSTIATGRSTDLRWNVLGGVDIEIVADGQVVASGLPGQGTLNVSPAATTDYELRATNAVGTATATTRVTVTPIAIDSFLALPSAVAIGSTTTLSWTATGTGELELVGFGAVPLVGNRDVTVSERTTFVLIARSEGVEVDRATVTVEIIDAGLNLARWSWADDGTSGNPPIVQPFVPFEAWIIGEGLSGGLLAFEFHAEVPPELLVIAAGPPQSTGLVIFGHPDWVVGTGQCLFQDVIPMLRYQLLSLAPLPYGTVLDISGLPNNPSLPTGEPAFSNCADTIVPFQIGAPLPVGEIIVPAVTVDLQAAAGPGGVQLRWTADGVDCADRVHVFRTVGDDAVERIAELRDFDACGEWTDAAAPARLDDVRYRVTLETRDAALVSADVDVRSAPNAGVIPTRSKLLANVPNPFNPATELRFALAKEGSVRLSIYDTAGRRVRQLDLGRQPAGEGQVTWTGLDDAGRPVGSGVYLVRLNTQDGVDTRRILLVK